MGQENISLDTMINFWNLSDFALYVFAVLVITVTETMDKCNFKWFNVCFL